jgi:hypothetical protein
MSGRTFNRQEGPTPPVGEDGSAGIDELRVKIDQKYYSRVKSAPTPMRQEAYHGLLGEFIRIAAPQTEACPEALLVQSLVGIGNMIGRDPWLNQADFHHTNEYMVLVGDTSAGRKGTSWRVVNGLLHEVDPKWSEDLRTVYTKEFRRVKL